MKVEMGDAFMYTHVNRNYFGLEQIGNTAKLEAGDVVVVVSECFRVPGERDDVLFAVASSGTIILTRAFKFEGDEFFKVIR